MHGQPQYRVSGRNAGDVTRPAVRGGNDKPRTPVAGLRNAVTNDGWSLTASSNRRSSRFVEACQIAGRKTTTPGTFCKSEKSSPRCGKRSPNRPLDADFVTDIVLRIEVEDLLAGEDQPAIGGGRRHSLGETAVELRQFGTPPGNPARAEITGQHVTPPLAMCGRRVGLSGVGMRDVNRLRPCRVESGPASRRHSPIRARETEDSHCDPLPRRFPGMTDADGIVRRTRGRRPEWRFEHAGRADCRREPIRERCLGSHATYGRRRRPVQSRRASGSAVGQLSLKSRQGRAKLQLGDEDESFAVEDPVHEFDDVFRHRILARGGQWTRVIARRRIQKRARINCGSVCQDGEHQAVVASAIAGTRPRGWPQHGMFPNRPRLRRSIPSKSCGAPKEATKVGLLM